MNYAVVILFTFTFLQVWAVFRDVCRFWRVQNKCPSKLRRSGSDREPISPDTIRLLCSATISPSSLIPSSCSGRPTGILGRRWTEVELEEENENECKDGEVTSPSEIPFRGRASTDGHLLQRTWKWRYPPPVASSSQQTFYPSARADRRMSISMRGNNASY